MLTKIAATATKRPHPADENSPAGFTIYSSPPKRVKQALSSVAETFIKHAPPTPTRRRAFGADVTNTTRSRVTGGKAAKEKDTKPSRSILKPALKKPASPVPAVPTRPCSGRASPRIGSGRGVKRAFTRVDPPATPAPTATSIDALLFRKPVPASVLTPTIHAPAPAPAVAAAELLAPGALPDAWLFDIHEDTPDEHLQNIMEHGTHALDISDASSDDEPAARDELNDRGKENIPPARLAELLAARGPAEAASLAALERATAASAALGRAVAAATSSKPSSAAITEGAIPQRKLRGWAGGKILAEHREALREMRREELELPKPDLPKAAFEFKCHSDPTTTAPIATPQKQQPPSIIATPPSPGSPGFVVWESDHEDEAEADNQNSEETDENALPSPTPKDEFDYFELARNIPLPESPIRRRDRV